MSKIRYRSGYRYQLQADYSVFIGLLGYKIRTDFITLTESGWLTIRRGYAWDGVTGLWFTPQKLVLPSLVHDVLYQAIRLGYPVKRADADREFWRAMRYEGVWPPVAAALWGVVRVAGWGFV